MSSHHNHQGRSQRSWKGLARGAGIALALGGVGYVLNRVWHTPDLFSVIALLPMADAVLIFLGANLALGLAFLILLNGTLSTRNGLVVLRLYGRSQIAKYLPGSIAQYIGRHGLGIAAGLDHGPLVRAALLEVLSLIAVAVAIGLAGLPLLNSGIDVLTAGLIGTVCLAVSILIAGLKWPPLTWSLAGVSIMAPVMTCHALVIAGSGYGLWAVMPGTSAAVSPGMVIALYAAAWLGGFLVPAAPAGLGIRDALLLVSLTGLVGETQASAMVIGHRLANLLADLLFFMLSMTGSVSRLRARGRRPPTSGRNR